MNNNIFARLNEELNSDNVGTVQICMTIGENEIVVIRRPYIVADDREKELCMSFDDNSFSIPKTMSGEVVEDIEETVYIFTDGTVKIEVAIGY